jgi:outer membrane receptor for ferrienterochelin and colicin
VRIARVLLGCVAITCSVAAARAADEEVRRSEEIVVEEKTDQPPLETFGDRPVETEVIRKEEIQERPGTDAADIVRHLPGIRTQQRVQGEEAAVSVEGLPPEFSRVLVDGRRYSGQIGGVDDLSDIPLVGVERLEVVRGAQGLRYGSDAAGAVIRTITEDPPRDGRRVQADVGIGDQGKIVGAATAGYGNEFAGATLRFLNDQIDGYDAPSDVIGDAVFIPSSSQSRRVARDVYGVGRVDPLDTLSMHTRIGYRRENEKLVGVGGTDVNGTSDETRWLATQEAEWAFGPASTLRGKATFYRDELESSVGRDFTLAENEPDLDVELEHLLETGFVSHALTLGADFQRPTLDLEEGALPPDLAALLPPPSAVGEYQVTSGVYGIAESQLASWLALETGVRAQFHSDFSPEVVPQVALVATPWEGDGGRVVRLRVSYGRSYRTPSLRDLFQPPVPQIGGAYFLAGNPDLTPESLVSYRAGIEAVPLPWVSLSMIGFYHDISDHIRSSFAGSLPIGTETVPAPPDPTLDPLIPLICRNTTPPNKFGNCPGGGTIVVPVNAPLFVKNNLDRVRSAGIESRVRFDAMSFAPWAQFEVGYTFQQTSVRDSNIALDELPNEPHHVVDLTLGLEAPHTGTRLTTLARFRSSALTETSGTGLLGFGSPEKSQPSWTVDLRVEQPIGPNYAIYADVYNVSDQRIVDSYIVRGRSFFIGVRATFQ